VLEQEGVVGRLGVDATSSSRVLDLLTTDNGVSADTFRRLGLTFSAE
jgi:hypothetical protein